MERNFLKICPFSYRRFKCARDLQIMHILYVHHHSLITASIHSVDSFGHSMPIALEGYVRLRALNADQDHQWLHIV